MLIVPLPDPFFLKATFNSSESPFKKNKKENSRRHPCSLPLGPSLSLVQRLMLFQFQFNPLQPQIQNQIQKPDRTFNSISLSQNRPHTHTYIHTYYHILSYTNNSNQLKSKAVLSPFLFPLRKPATSFLPTHSRLAFPCTIYDLNKKTSSSFLLLRLLNLIDLNSGLRGKWREREREKGWGAVRLRFEI